MIGVFLHYCNSLAPGPSTVFVLRFALSIILCIILKCKLKTKIEGPGNEATIAASFVGNPALVLTWSFMSAPTVSPAGYKSFWGEVRIR